MDLEAGFFVLFFWDGTFSYKIWFYEMLAFGIFAGVVSTMCLYAEELGLNVRELSQGKIVESGGEFKMKYQSNRKVTYKG